MAPSTAIFTSNISKRYIIPHNLARRLGVRAALEPNTDDALHTQKKFKRREIFWALKDVSFKIARGEQAALIGVNGSGKSTLLKILSRVVIPTYGEGRIFGRVTSLLELGTGFHPELTGRENIALNATILGASRQEIRRNFDSIVEFSEIGNFIDLPIKRYSSGMVARLGFGIAFHIESEILIVDEVLAVGDFAFRAKCFKRMEALCASGRTLLFVSHGDDNLRKLCNRGILLDHGRVIMDDDIHSALDYYTSNYNRQPRNVWKGDTGNNFIRVHSMHIHEYHIQQSKEAVYDDSNPIQLTIEYELLKKARNFHLSVQINNEAGAVGRPEFNYQSVENGVLFSEKGRHTVTIKFRLLHYGAGIYVVNLIISADNKGNFLLDSPTVIFKYKPRVLSAEPRIDCEWQID